MTEASQQVSYKDLDRAADAALGQEEVVTEEVAEDVVEDQEVSEDVSEVSDEQKQRDTENAERSKLGRKVKTLEEQITRLSGLLERKQQEQEPEDSILTPENLPKYIERLEQERSHKKQEYSSSYTSKFAEIGAEDENFDDVWAEMYANHNAVVTGDPSVDAQINYLKAQNALLKKGPKNPVQGKGATTNTAVNIPDGMQKKQTVMPKLDHVAAEFLKKTGLSPEWAAKKLK